VAHGGEEPPRDFAPDKAVRVEVARGGTVRYRGQAPLVEAQRVQELPVADGVGGKVTWESQPRGRLVVELTVGGAVHRFTVEFPEDPNRMVVNGKALLEGTRVQFVQGDRLFDVSLHDVSSRDQFIIRTTPADIQRNVLRLDAVFDKVTPGSYVVLERAGPPPEGIDSPLVARVEAVATLSHAEFGLTGTVTQVTLDRPWLAPSDVSLGDIRGVTVYLQSEPLDLAGEPYDADIGPAFPGDPAADTVELDRVYGGLPTGRWLVVAGDRTDVPGAAGVKAAELVMLAASSQVVDAPNTPGQGRPHTVLRLAAPMRYSFQRGTATVYGNVAPADQGETRAEVLGGGDAAAAGQKFTLAQAPLTFVAAPVPSGVADTLRVRVNDILWGRTDSPGALGPADRGYTLRLDEDGRATVVFGDGEHGARLPTGVNNVRAVYRFGMDRSGNVGPGRVSQLVSRPLGVRDVTNPLAAAGGADRESLDSARRNAPRGVTALGRLVAVEDYADFALGFAGVAKAAATRLSDGRGVRVHLTVAGPDGEPIGKISDLFHNLQLALRRFGDPSLPVTVDNLRPRLIALQARVRVRADAEFEAVVRQARATLFDRFGFDRREFGQCVALGALVAAVQTTPGVEAVAVERFGLLDPGGTLQDLIDQLNHIAQGAPAEILPVHLARRGPGGLEPAEVAFLTPRMGETLILNEAPP
jgi:hypothetical protein